MCAKPRLGITMGDPSGIGSEIIVKAYSEASTDADLVVVGDAGVMRDAVRVADSALGVNVVGSVTEAAFADDAIDVLDLDNVRDLTYGALNAEYGKASLAYIERAVELAQEGAIDGIVTAPINKQATRSAGGEHAGHTGLLAERTGTEEYSMMLIEADLRVTHVSTHVPLREACDLVTTDSVGSVIELTHDALRELGVGSPTIAVAGLNPHASDGGLLGEEEETEIAPAIEHARNEGIDVEGPESPDTVYFRAARGEFNCVVSLYHDQGHIPIKLLGFERGAENAMSGVNMTIGLPIVRTSVDHGTAFDIAGEGVASPRSLVDAVSVATRVAAHRFNE